MTTEQALINGINLVYEKEGSGPPIVFLHGGNASAVWWEALIPHLMGDYTCISLESRGHGRSGRAPDGDYSLPILVEECIGFLDAVVGPVIIVGQSQGGAVAMGTAAKRPDRVRAIYLEDSVPSIYGARRHNSMPILQWFKAVGVAAEAKERDQLTIAQHAYNIGQLAPFRRRVIDVWPPGQLIFYARHAYGTDPAWYPFVAAGRTAWDDEEADALPAKVHCPVHVAYGDLKSGGLVTAEDLAVLAEAGVKLTSTHFPGAGHGISPDFPREFLNDLKAFLARV